MPFFCPYCGKSRADNELSQEHVLPKALGGNVEPTNPFALDVCKPCNVACGKHVDGPFIRSWLTQMDRFANARRYLDLSRDPAIPLLYMGETPSLQWEGKICDYWQGPAGDSVFHFHARYPNTDGVRPEVGRPLNARAADVDPGFVVIFIVASNPAWWRCILRSVLEQIDNAVVYLANATHVPVGNPRFAPIPESLSPLISQLKATFEKPLENRIAISTDAGKRFLAKLALGFGSLFLRPSFKASADATLLRDYLWGQKPEDREVLQVHGTAFFENLAAGPSTNSNLNGILGWKPGHVILLQVFDRLALSVMFYGSQSATIVVSSTREHWTGVLGNTGGLEGTMFLVAPGFRRFMGPMPLSRYVAASVELKRGNVLPGVGTFLHQVESHPPPPPFNLEESPSSP